MNDQKIETKREISLNENVTKLINETNAELQKVLEQLKPFKEKYDLLNEGMNKLITGICLQEGVDGLTEGIYFNDEKTVIYVHDLPTKEVIDEGKPTGKVSKVKKM